MTYLGRLLRIPKRTTCHGSEDFYPKNVDLSRFSAFFEEFYPKTHDLSSMAEALGAELNSLFVFDFCVCPVQRHA